MRRSATPWLFIAPWLIGFLLLTVYPFVASLWWSFCEYDLLSPPRFIGIQNYQRLGREVLGGEGLGQALWNTAYFALVSVPLSVVLGITLASMLSWNVRGRSVFRAIFFLPSILPIVSVCVLWLWLLDPRDGLVNYWLAMIGSERQLWFHGAHEFVLTANMGSKDGLILMSLWGIGNLMIIYLAALGDIPHELYEAADLDGAGMWRKLWHITLPMLTPVIFFNIVIGLIDAVQLFTPAYIVSEGTGQPAGTAMLVSLYLFLAAFQDLEVGYASAVAWILLVLLALATVGLFASAQRWVHYRGAAA